MASSSWFRAYLPKETASTASSDLYNVNQVDPGSLPISGSLAHIRDCCAEVECGDGELSLKPVG